MFDNLTTADKARCAIIGLILAPLAYAALVMFLSIGG